MKKKTIVLLLAFTICALGVYGMSTAEVKIPRGDLILISKKVKSAPSDANSPQWGKAKESAFLLEGAGTVEGKRIEQKVKSVYTKDEIFFLFEWPDKDKTLNKNRWRYTGDKWSKIKGDEDRLGVLFEINRVNKFANKGCSILCHNESKNEKDWYFAVSTKKEKADLWHWKSVRSNPVGYTEDGYVIANPSKKPEKGRKRDQGSGKAKSNRIKDKSGPSHMQDPSKSVFSKDSLLVSEATRIKDYSMFKKGDEIPGYMLNRVWKGSFADIKTRGVWKDGKWTVMMWRKVDTGNDDDIKFNTRKTYTFGIAVFDNAHEHNSYNSEPLKLKFK